MRVGLVGVGRWGRLVLRDLVALDCQVVAVARRDETRRAARDGGASSVVPEVSQIGDVDGVVVVVPVAVHGEVVEEVLDRVEVPVFVEKPLTNDPASSRRVAERGVDRLFVMDKWRYHPAVETLRDLARSGELGRVVGLRTTRVQWRTSHHDVDGIWILAPHDLAIALEILDHLPQPRAAAAQAGDAGAGLVGLLGEDPWLCLEVSTASPGWRREVVVYCDRGSARLSDGYADHVEVARDGSETLERIPVSTELPLLRELRAFLRHLEGGAPPRSSAEEGVRAVETIARLRELAGMAR